MTRSTRLDAPGALYHVIIRGIERRRIVDDEKDRQAFVEQITQQADPEKNIVYQVITGWKRQKS